LGIDVAHAINTDTPRTQMVPVASIVIRPEHRNTRPKAVVQLAASIRDLGMQMPIIVRTLPDREGSNECANTYVLIAGAHRVAATKSLGSELIAAIVLGPDVSDLDAELLEIDENLCRAALSPAERSAAMTRRKQIYLKKHPETQHGGGGKGRDMKSRKVCDSTVRFTKDTAEKTHRGERSVQLDVHRGEEIGPERPVRLVALRWTREWSWMRSRICRPRSAMP
jgi:hypothetical protein